jgi:hypothetical protein
LHELVEAVLRKPEYERKLKAEQLGERVNLTSAAIRGLLGDDWLTWRMKAAGAFKGLPRPQVRDTMPRASDPKA